MDEIFKKLNAVHESLHEVIKNAEAAQSILEDCVGAITEHENAAREHEQPAETAPADDYNERLAEALKILQSLGAK